MTRLIDKDYLIEEIRCSPVGQLLIRKHNLDGMIEKFPEVDAIPVNWMTNLAKEYEESDNQFFRMDSCVIEDLIKRWKEQEKNND